MSKITIIKAKLLKGDKVEIDFTKQDSADETPNECTEKSTNKPTAAFVASFDALAVHAAIIFEFVPLTKVKDIDNPEPELFSTFRVTGFTIVKPGDDDEGVILHGQKTFKTGKKSTFPCPLVLFNDESENAYEHIDVLDKAIKECEDRAREYLNGTYAPDIQGKLELE